MCIVNSFAFVFAQSERDTKVGLKLERTVGLVEVDLERAIGGLFADRHLPQAPVPVILGMSWLWKSMAFRLGQTPTRGGMNTEVVGA